MGAGFAAKAAEKAVEGIGAKAAAAANNLQGRQGFEALLQATPQMPTASGLINASKVCESGCLLPTVTASERALVESIVATGDRTGLKTEQLIEAIAKREGLTSYSAKYGSNNGFDHVLVAPDGTVTIIVDSKQMRNGTFRLSNGAEGHQQLSAAWINSVTNRLPLYSPAREKIRSALAGGSLRTAVAGVNKETGSIVIVPIR